MPPTTPSRASENRTSFLFFALTLVAGIFILAPFHNFQLHLAQGDHGRDLYCFRQILNGQVPYRDFCWPYGPLMLYFYALCYKILGINIHSVLMGQHFLFLLCGLSVFLTINIFAAGYLALTAAVWFWVFFPPFEHTYNHIGGILMILLSVYFLLKYLRSTQIHHLWAGLLCVVLLSFIKINFGISTLAAFITAVIIVDRYNGRGLTAEKRIFYLCALLAAPLLMAGTYAAMLAGLPGYFIKQCLPYGSSYLQTRSAPLESIQLFWQNFAVTTAGQAWHGWLLILELSATGWLTYLLWRKKMPTTGRQELFLVLGSLIIFSFFTLHEFFLNATMYRAHWNKPVQTLFVFLVLAVATRQFPARFKILLCLTLLTAAGHRHLLHRQFVPVIQVPLQYISLERGKIYIGNSFPWLSVVQNSCQYLQKNLKEGETFIALIDDALYYFLTDKPSPTPVLTFSEHSHLPPEQETEIIKALEKKQVNYVLISNRANSKEPGMGYFGKTYCPLLAGYIADNFRSMAVFGEWDQDPGWVTKHAVEILKRRGVPQE